jgi:hypothetical protein
LHPVAETVEHDGRALRGEGFGDAEAYAACGARNKRDTTFQRALRPHGLHLCLREHVLSLL